MKPDLFLENVNHGIQLVDLGQSFRGDLLDLLPGGNDEVDDDLVPGVEVDEDGGTHDGEEHDDDAVRQDGLLSGKGAVESEGKEEGSGHERLDDDERDDHKVRNAAQALVLPVLGS